MLRYCTVVFVLCFVHTKGEDSSPQHQHYLRAFENLPTLFNHIIGMLQEKPEILEKNDVTTFLESALDGDVDISPRENAPNVFKRQSNFEDVDQNTVNKDSVHGYDWGVLRVDSDSEAFVGSVPGFRLTAEEVAERMLMVERKLEEYYNETN